MSRLGNSETKAVVEGARKVATSGGIHQSCKAWRWAESLSESMDEDCRPTPRTG
jgi:hypothetical protein